MFHLKRNSSKEPSTIELRAVYQIVPAIYLNYFPVTIHRIDGSVIQIKRRVKYVTFKYFLFYRVALCQSNFEYFQIIIFTSFGFLFIFFLSFIKIVRNVSLFSKSILVGILLIRQKDYFLYTILISIYNTAVCVCYIIIYVGLLPQSKSYQIFKFYF